MTPSVRVAGHAVARRRDPRITVTAASVVTAAVAITAAAVLGPPGRPWSPIGVAIGIFAIVALVRPLEPAPGEKITLAAAIAFFAAAVLPASEAVAIIATGAIIAKIVQQVSLINAAVNIAILSAATGLAAIVLATPLPGSAPVLLVIANVAYSAVTLAGVGAMIVASQGARAVVPFLRRELLPTATLVSVGAIGALLWRSDDIAVVLLAVPLAAIERGLRLAARERATVEAMRAASEAQRQFTEDAAHEIRTPLTALIGDLAYVNTGSLDPAEAAALASAQRTAGSLRLLTDRLLAFSRAGVAGTGGRADLADVARDVIARVAPRTGVTLRLSAPDSLEVAVAPELARAVLQDIVTNAAAYTEAGSIELAVEERGGSAIVRVTDTGIGIPADELERVFERFFRGARAHALAPGSGLGLAIVRRIVEAHGGSLTLSSEVGRGTTLLVELPRVPGAPARSALVERS